MLRWLDRLRAEANGPATAEPPFLPIRILARAMCCAVGHRAPAATAALNARINHFQEGRFVSEGGHRIVVGMLHGLEAWGMERVQAMLQAVIDEAMPAQERQHLAAETALLLCCAEAERPGIDAATFERGLMQLAGAMGFHPTSAAMRTGKGGLGDALFWASRQLHPTSATTAASRDATHRTPRLVLLVGIDSLLVAGTVEHLLAAERLQTRTHADGLIPAEGAAAILLEAAPAADSGKRKPGLHIDGVAVAQEAWRFGADTPLRAQGLTQAVRSALAGANAELSNLGFQLSGANGEAWCAREITLMQSRCMKRKRREFAHLAPAQWLGDTGAAGPVLALAWMAGLMTRQDGLSPGPSALAHFAGDDGRRSALVLRVHPPASDSGLPSSGATHPVQKAS